jgi:GPH family glycoside/pentoside/hexuronide:cation symporter
VFHASGTGAGADLTLARGNYASMGVAFGLAIMAVALAATLGTLHERSRLSSSAAPTGGIFTLHRTALGTLRDHSFQVLFFSSSLAAMGVTINAALGMHFLTYHARIDASQAFTLYFVAFYAGAVAGVFIWVRVTRWIEKHHVYAVTTLAAAFVVSGGYWLVGEGRPFGTGNSWILVLGNGLVGVLGTAGAVVVPSMMADITAHDELRAGHRRDGIFFGMHCFGQKLSGGFAVFIAGLLVDHFAGLVPGQAEQSATTADRLAMISSLLPAIMLLSAGIIALRYRLTRKVMEFAPRDSAAVPELVQAPQLETAFDAERPL